MHSLSVLNFLLVIVVVELRLHHNLPRLLFLLRREVQSVGRHRLPAMRSGSETLAKKIEIRAQKSTQSGSSKKSIRKICTRVLENFQLFSSVSHFCMQFQVRTRLFTFTAIRCVIEGFFYEAWQKWQLNKAMHLSEAQRDHCLWGLSIEPRKFETWK